MSGIAILKKLLLQQAVKGSGQASGIMSIGDSVRKIADKKLQSYIMSAKKQGVDLDKLSEQEIKYILAMNKPKPVKAISADSPEGKLFTQGMMDMLDKASGKNVIKTDFGGGITDSVTETITKIKTLKPMDAMKEANKVLKGEGRYKSLSKADRKKIVDDESVTDHIFERNIIDETEDFAHGGRTGTGLNYLLGEDDENVRVPFGAGGFNKARRMFLQAIGVGAAGVGAAKSGLFGLLKSGKPTIVKDLAQVPIKNIKGMPDWYIPLVNKIIKTGDEVESGAERVITHKSKLPDSKTDIYVEQNLDTGDVVVDIGQGKHGWADGHFGQPVRLEYKAAEDIYSGPSDEPFKIGERDPLLRVKSSVHEDLVGSGLKGDPKSLHLQSGKTKEEFWVEEAEFTGGHPENIKFEESSFEKFGEHGSNFDEVEKFATGKVKKVKPTKKKKATEFEQGRAENEYDLQKNEGYFDEAEKDFYEKASGGRVPLAGGKGVMSLIQKLFKKKPETLKEFIERREFIKGLIGNTTDMKNKRVLQEILEENKNVKGFEFPDAGPGSDIHKEIEMILNKDVTKHATGGRVSLSSGGLAGMLGE